MLSVIIAWKSGDKLRETAFQNTLECIKMQGVESELIIVGEREKEKPFNKSWLYNIGVKKAQSDNLLFVDADMLFGCDYFKLVNKKAETCRVFSGYERILALSGRDNPLPRWVTFSLTDALGGVWFCKKDLYWEIGGSNESYFGYGCEDNDIKTRVLWWLGTDQMPYLPYTLFHQYHDWANVETREYKANCELLSRVKNNPRRFVEALKKLDLGNETQPTPIQSKDL